MSAFSLYRFRWFSPIGMFVTDLLDETNTTTDFPEHKSLTLLRIHLQNCLREWFALRQLVVSNFTHEFDVFSDSCSVKIRV